MRNKLLYGIAGVIVLVFLAAAIFAIRNKPETVPAEGEYKTITAVSGVSFLVNSGFVNKATAISEISANVQIDPDLFYVYKDGSDNYLLFNMNSLVVAVQKGTSFHFDEYDDSDKEKTLENSSVAGVWMEKNGNKFSYEEKNGVFTANVTGGLVITNDMYNDFVGQIRIISDGATEWAIFVGIPSTEKYKNLSDNAKKGIETMVDSLSFSVGTSELETESYAVVIGNTEMESVETTDQKVEQTAAASEKNTPPSSTEPTEEEDEEKDIGTGDDADEETEQTTEAISDPASVEQNSDNGQDESKTVDSSENQENKETSEPVETGNLETVSTAETSSARTVSMSNQKTILNKSEEKAYTSDIYSMLALKENGLITELDPETGETVTPVISIQRVYTGQSALDIIKDYCKSGNSLFQYFDAPAGCTWHVAEYKLSYKGCTTRPYINVKLKGMDGETLKVNGISYDKRTYDITYKATESGDFAGPYYCFYAVPNGWSEYVLECGTGNIDIPNDVCKAAYYKIQK